MKLSVVAITGGEFAFVADPPVCTEEEAEAAAHDINIAIAARERLLARLDRSHMPPHVRSNPDTRTWHWNEHALGKFAKEIK
jgi:hypothetical protein